MERQRPPQSNQPRRNIAREAVFGLPRGIDFLAYKNGGKPKPPFLVAAQMAGNLALLHGEESAAENAARLIEGYYKIPPGSEISDLLEWVYPRDTDTSEREKMSGRILPQAIKALNQLFYSGAVDPKTTLDFMMGTNPNLVRDTKNGRAQHLRKDNFALSLGAAFLTSTNPVAGVIGFAGGIARNVAGGSAIDLAAQTLKDKPDYSLVPMMFNAHAAGLLERGEAIPQAAGKAIAMSLLRSSRPDLHRIPDDDLITTMRDHDFDNLYMIPDLHFLGDPMTPLYPSHMILRVIPSEIVRFGEMKRINLPTPKAILAAAQAIGDKGMQAIKALSKIEAGGPIVALNVAADIEPFLLVEAGYGTDGSDKKAQANARKGSRFAQAGENLSSTGPDAYIMEKFWQMFQAHNPGDMIHASMMNLMGSINATDKEYFPRNMLTRIGGGPPWASMIKTLAIAANPSYQSDMIGLADKLIGEGNRTDIFALMMYISTTQGHMTSAKEMIKAMNDIRAKGELPDTTDEEMAALDVFLKISSAHLKNVRKHIATEILTKSFNETRGLILMDETTLKQRWLLSKHQDLSFQLKWLIAECPEAREEILTQLKISFNQGGTEGNRLEYSGSFPFVLNEVASTARKLMPIDRDPTLIEIENAAVSYMTSLANDILNNNLTPLGVLAKGTLISQRDALASNVGTLSSLVDMLPDIDFAQFYDRYMIEIRFFTQTFLNMLGEDIATQIDRSPMSSLVTMYVSLIQQMVRRVPNLKNLSQEQKETMTTELITLAHTLTTKITIHDLERSKARSGSTEVNVAPRTVVNNSINQPNTPRSRGRNGGTGGSSRLQQT